MGFSGLLGVGCYIVKAGSSEGQAGTERQKDSIVASA